MSGELEMGDNPLDTYFPTFPHHSFPHFTTTFLCSDSENKDFSPLLIVPGPVFLVLYFPAKKG
jgi:hypothetical protein